ncbi:MULTISPECIES: hypothetical protein [Clostridium]|uniref:hypothetical protein n=1 Tax=Clostridium TaxID=1485 RepID=UPI0001AAD3C2|nr:MULTISPECIES: hypothetical protein [Clostridium]EES50942.1 hypothetical protein CLO_1411 [Clostridium botulinum E1 str. 'BoNT E Beluga']MBY6760559.1 hypothetical protein [Clostridium botulinum]MBY6919466.1 hypothetical protein [Clostridium botulinum]MCR1130344.1 hypothetical protein [Clostridium botulinum]HBZ6635750.1 hypothetical protein [Clostridium botulinum]
MNDKEKIVDHIVVQYFKQPEKTLEEIFDEYIQDLSQPDADRVLRNIREIIN